MSSFYSELKRRNVVKVGIAYAITGRVVVEIAAVLLPIFSAPAWLVLVLAIAACGGGSSAPDPVAVTPPVVVSKATVAIILTDATADDYDHAFVNITSVELLSDAGNQTIFEGDEIVDLLALRDTVQLFAVNENVNPTIVEKIRIKATGMVLVVDNNDGSTTETIVELVANGKIDLNPRGPIPIAAGEVVFISLDWDVNESLKLTETGQGHHAPGNFCRHRHRARI